MIILSTLCKFVIMQLNLSLLSTHVCRLNIPLIFYLCCRTEPMHGFCNTKGLQILSVITSTYLPGQEVLYASNHLVQNLYEVHVINSIKQLAGPSLTRYNLYVFFSDKFCSPSFWSPCYPPGQYRYLYELS